MCEHRLGKPRTSTDERSVKLVADALEEDRRESCEERSRATVANILKENVQEQTAGACSWATRSP